MKAAVLIEARKLVVRDVPQPEPGPGQVLVRILLAGICGSDHALYQGKFDVPLPVIPGHEAVGRIEALGGQVSGLTIGQRVAIQPNIACGRCPSCRAGLGNICPAKIRIGVDTDGVFAQFIAVPAACVWPLPDAIADEVAVFTEPLAVAVHAVKKRAARQKERTLIFGAGIVGLLVLQLAVLRNAEPAACDLHDTRLAMAKRLGAGRTFDARRADESLWGSFDLIYETSGAPSALAQVIRLAAGAGKIVVLGLAGRDHPVPADLIVRRELQIMGSLIYTSEFAESITLLNSGQVQTGLLCTGRLTLDELGDSLCRFNSPERMKMLVEIPPC